MQRIIKFRAWDVINKRMKVTGFGINEGVLAGDDIEIMQYTGLKDKNGVEIYEGDLLRNESGRICVVNWEEFAASFDCEPVVIVRNDNSGGFEPNLWSGWIEVIGNIHQNRELMEK